MEALADEEEVLTVQMATNHFQIAQLETEIEGRVAEYHAVVSQSDTLIAKVASLKTDLASRQQVLGRKLFLSGQIYNRIHEDHASEGTSDTGEGE